MIGLLVKKIGYFNYCKEYQNRKEVFDEWIKFNNSILQHVKGSELNKDSISILVEIILDKILRIVESNCVTTDIFDSFSPQLKVFEVCHRNDPQFSLIKDIINLEWAYKDKPYCIIYRGIQKYKDENAKFPATCKFEAKGFPSFKKLSIASVVDNGSQYPLTLSYSDGVFWWFL